MKQAISLEFDLGSFDCFGRGDEPEPLKRLKREMGVALAEEDYVTAGGLHLCLLFTFIALLSARL